MVCRMPPSSKPNSPLAVSSTTLVAGAAQVGTSAVVRKSRLMMWPPDVWNAMVASHDEPCRVGAGCIQRIQ